MRVPGINSPHSHRKNDLKALSREAKEKSYEAMKLEPGYSCMDFGCGKGEDLPALSGRVGLEGEVWGVEKSAEMIRYGIQNNSLPNVRFSKTSSEHLNFPEGFFASIRAEHVFQYLEHPETTLKELSRVTRLGGNIILLEIEWGSLELNTSHPSIFREIQYLFRTYYTPNHLSSEQVENLYHLSKLELTERHILPIASNDLELFHLFCFDRLTELEELTQRISKLDMEIFLRDLVHKAKANTFHFQVNQVLFTGRKVSHSGQVTPPPLASSQSF